MTLDLHSHSTVSDGVLSPERLVLRAGMAGVSVLALTDHDTVGGIARARAAAPDGLEILPGIEISAHHPLEDGSHKDVHVLGYFPPSKLEAWAGFQAKRRVARRERFDAMIERLESLGAAIDREAVFAEREADPESVPGRPHLARALIAAGHVQDMEEAFQRFLGREAPAYVADRGPTVAEAIAEIHGNLGLAFIAHPIYGDLDQDLPTFREAGLDGVEAFHFSHDPEQRAHYSQLASDLGLLVSAGSDYHGSAEDPDGLHAHERLGTIEWNVDRQDAFLEALAARSGWAPKRA